MERITISLDESLAKDFDRIIRERHYASRSEAMRDLLRREVETHRQARETRSHCVANLCYVYNHRERQLAERLAQAQHEHHDLVGASMRVLLDHENCLETVILKGPVPAVRAFAERIQAERGVRHGALNLISVDPGDGHHGAGAHQHHGHLHLIPST